MSQAAPHDAEWKNRARYATMLSQGMSPDEIYEEISGEFPQVSLPDLRMYLARCDLIEGGKWSPEDSVPFRLNSNIDVFFSFPPELEDHPELPAKVVNRLPIAYFPIIDTTKSGTKFGLRAIPRNYPGREDAEPRWGNERRCMKTGSRSLEFRLPRRLGHTMGLSEMFDDYSPETDQLQTKGDSEVIDGGVLSSVDEGMTFGDDGDAEVSSPAEEESEVTVDLSIENGGVTAHFSPAPSVWTPSSVSDPLAEGSDSNPPAPDSGAEPLESREIPISRSWDSVPDDEKTPWNFSGYQLVIPTDYVAAYEVESGDSVRQHLGAVSVDGRRRLAHIIRFDDEADETPSIRSNIFESSKNKAADTMSQVITPNRALMHSLGIGVRESMDPPHPLMYPGEDYVALLPNPDE